jgi:hypothetical protein
MTVAYEELVDFIAAGTTSQAVADFVPSASTQARVQELLESRKSGQISMEEAAELESFLHIEHLMRLAKARARQRLAKPF